MTYQYGTVTLGVGEYRVAIGFKQGTGGAGVAAKWAYGSTTDWNSMGYVNGTNGHFFLDFSAPGNSITNTAATDVTYQTAVLRGTLLTPQARYDVYVHWGLTNGTNNAAAWATNAYVGSYTNLASVSVSNMVTGLSEGTTYWYTFRASNALEQMWASPSTNFVTGWRPRELEVVSTHGTPSPAVGIHTNDYGSSVTCRVTEVVAEGVTTQYVCAGWVMTGGQTPATGSTTNFTMTHTNDTVLTWQWATKYWLDLGTNGNGTVTPPDQWVTAGGTVALAATPGPGYRFVNWSGDTSLITSGNASSSAVTVTVTRAASLTATFALPGGTVIIFR
jgi:hypothetical protein